jgi:hypothetical protein
VRCARGLNAVLAWTHPPWMMRRMSALDVVARQALSQEDSPYGAVGILHSGSDLEARWIWKDGEEVEPTLSVMDRDDLLYVVRGSLRLELRGTRARRRPSRRVVRDPGPHAVPWVPLAERQRTLPVPRSRTGRRDLHPPLKTPEQARAGENALCTQRAGQNVVIELEVSSIRGVGASVRCAHGRDVAGALVCGAVGADRRGEHAS